MCGIAGYAVVKGDADPWMADLPHAVKSLEHRGPDDNGLWFGAGGRVGFGHRRLSILDLSRARPPADALGRRPLIMVFNGEVYNFARAARASWSRWATASAARGDSEVILAAFAQWGVERGRPVHRHVRHRALGQARARALHAAARPPGREAALLRVGRRARCWFGSELKALRAFRRWQPEIDRDALGEYLQYGYITAPRSIYRDVCKLLPGHWLELGERGRAGDAPLLDVLDALEPARAGQRGRARATQLEALMIDAFRLAHGLRRAGGRVPLGRHRLVARGRDPAAHGGGERQAPSPSASTTRASTRRRTRARSRAHLGHRPHRADRSTRPTPSAILPQWARPLRRAVRRLLGHADLPGVAGSRAEHVKVVLSADGGDELFSGYNNYAAMLAQWRCDRGCAAAPARLRRGRARTASRSTRSTSCSPRSSGCRGGHLAWPPASDSACAKIARRVDARGRRASCSTAAAATLRPGRARRASTGRRAPTRAARRRLSGLDGRADVPLGPAQLPARRHAGEGRPRHDGGEHRGARAAARPSAGRVRVSLPFAMRRGALGAKHLLRKVLYRYVPRALVERPKQGFAVPVQQWLRGDLARLVHEHLEPGALARAGDVRPGDGRRVRAPARRRRRQRARARLDLVAFQMWHRRWMAAACESFRGERPWPRRRRAADRAPFARARAARARRAHLHAQPRHAANG